MLIVVLLLAHDFTRCPGAIMGGEETAGAMIYINEEFAGAMRKYEQDQYGFIETRLCKYIKKGDLLRAEKEGYQTFSTILDPSYDASASPSTWVWIKLTPLDESKQSPNL